jgi:hypothetical protein
MEGVNSFTGTTSILFALNYMPICTLLYWKQQKEDINIKQLIYKIS